MSTYEIPVEQYGDVSVLPVKAHHGYAPPDSYHAPGGGDEGFASGPAPVYPAAYGVPAPGGNSPVVPTTQAHYAGVAGASMHDFYSFASRRPSAPVVIRLCNDADCNRCKQVVSVCARSRRGLARGRGASAWRIGAARPKCAARIAHCAAPRLHVARCAARTRRAIVRLARRACRA